MYFVCILYSFYRYEENYSRVVQNRNDQQGIFAYRSVSMLLFSKCHVEHYSCNNSYLSQIIDSSITIIKFSQYSLLHSQISTNNITSTLRDKLCRLLD
ncbi:uncharacterized protein Smp_203110 [Schistosoma mansoni]|uniref:uncharacterized protein n=1 Tax=Schistosoma mansoni TaxID=6183 RepID=UPI00022DC665|nr:uncharacterized protein Smp_203110 [Schistosoma mansoni]|eukprot:XP_018653475.1 uncharacterized protein Smp_203110 [Schistosoma mansoni]